MKLGLIEGPAEFERTLKELIFTIRNILISRLSFQKVTENKGHSIQRKLWDGQDKIILTNTFRLYMLQHISYKKGGYYSCLVSDASSGRLRLPSSSGLLKGYPAYIGIK